jgi:PAS domain S-box-containing protein
VCIKGKDINKTKKQLARELESALKKVTKLEKKHLDIKKDLKAEQDKFEGLLNSLSDGIDIIDKNYRICYQNKMLIKRFGDLKGKLCFEAYMQRQTPCKFCLIKKAIKTGKTQRLELSAPDGKIYELTSTPFKDADGEIKVIEFVRDITENKEREKEYRNLIDGMNDTAFVTSFKGKILEVNDTAVKVLGYSREELLTMGPNDIDTVQNKKYISAVIERMKSGEKKVFETSHITKSGKTIPVEVSCSLINYHGNPSILSIARDITERKRREEEYKNLIDGMNDTAFVIDFEGNFIDVNNRAVEVLGYTRDELLDMGPTDIDTTLSAKKIKNLIEGMKKGERQVFPTTHRTKSGKILPVEVSSSLITYHGKPSILSIARDITERKKAEERLLESEERFQTVLENLPHGVCLHDLDGRILFANKATCEMTGYTQEELLNMNVADIDPGIRTRKDREKLWLKLKKGGFTRIESRHYHKKGVSVPMEIYISAVSLKGNPMILAIVHDITKQKEAQEKLKESEERFETVIENLPDEIFVHGLEGKFIMVNKASCEKTGYTKEELLNMEVADIDHESVRRDDRKNIWQKLQKKGGFSRIESTHYCKDGSSYPAEIYFGAVTFKGSPMIIGIVHDITERRKAIEKLKESEERFQIVIENLPHGVCLHDLNGNMTLVNKALCKLTGYSEKELLNMKVQEVDYECISRDDKHNLWLKLNKGGHDYVESTLYRKDGSTFPGVIYLNAINLKEKPMILAITQDVTERMKAIENLKESEERFQTVIEHLPHAVCVHDLDGNFTLVNEALCKQTGYTRDEFKKMKVSDIDPHSQTRNDRKKVWLNLKKGGHTHFESKLHCKDKSSYPVEIYLNAVTLEGSPLILAIAQDISERKEAIENLQRSEKKYRNLYESMLDAFVRTDLEGNILEFNKQYLDMLGYTEDEIKKIKYTDITPEKWHEMEEEIKQEQILKKGYSEVYEKEYIKKDGTIFPVELRRFLLTDDEKNPKGIWATVRDISERRKTEEELRKVERLESLGVLAGGIAHDFNNLLTGILGNLSLAQMGKEEDFEAILEEARHASIQAKNLTQQLLTFSKGGAPIKGTLNIEEVIRESAEFSLHGSNVSCKFNFANDLWKVKADKGQISQVIDNLVINANQAMPEGGKIRIKTENTILDEKISLPLPEGKYIKITFQDEGIGVPEEYLPKIFDPYFSTKQEGSGLGLATVYSVIQKHGGYTTVESEVGKGTFFYIYLPAIEEKTSIEEKEERKGIKRTPWGEGKILIMDDEKIVRRAVGGMLGRLGYLVEFAENGEEAIVKYKEAKKKGDPFHAVILDLTVPGGMGGKKTIEKLLQIDPDVKAIVSSGYSTDPVMANYEKYGFKAVVAKPFDLKGLDNTIKKVLG